MSEALRALGWTVTVHSLSAAFPHPDTDALDAADAILQRLPDATLSVVDGLAFGAMPELARRHAHRLALVALVHHPLAAETGLDPPTVQRLHRSERDALAAARHVITTSRATAASLRLDYGVAACRLSVVEPGTDPAAPAAGSGGPGVSLLCVGTLTPRKGHDLLLRALAGTGGDWRLVCAGSGHRDPGWAARLHALIRDLGLRDRVQLLGEVGASRLARCYHEADAFVLPTHLEGYGMALAEALARGLPVVSTRAGAVPETVGEEAALLVRAGDERALRSALQQVIADPALRARLALGARARAARLPTWDQAATRMSMRLRAVHTR
jgi:glycosyltransferase involved in cell wall biosynthesis